MFCDLCSMKNFTNFHIQITNKWPCTLVTEPNNRIEPALQGHIWNDRNWRSTCSAFSAAYRKWHRSDISDCLSFLMPCMFGQECYHPPPYGSGVTSANTKHNSTNHTRAQKCESSSSNTYLMHRTDVQTNTHTQCIKVRLHSALQKKWMLALHFTVND